MWEGGEEEELGKNSEENKGEKRRRSQQSDLRVVWENGVVYAAGGALQGSRPFGGDIRLTGQAPGSMWALVLEGQGGRVGEVGWEPGAQDKQSQTEPEEGLATWPPDTLR